MAVTHKVALLVLIIAISFWAWKVHGRFDYGRLHILAKQEVSD